MRLLPLLLLLQLAACSSLRTGWAKVTWLDGGVVPVSICTAQVGAEGDVEMYCTRSKQKHEKQSQPLEVVWKP